MTSMRKQIAHVSFLLLLLAGGATVAWAHHSQSQFEPEKTVVIQGTLTRLSWRNPHTLFLIQARPASSTDAEQEWTVEGPSPAQLTRAGWGRPLQDRRQGDVQRPDAARRQARRLLSAHAV